MVYVLSFSMGLVGLLGLFFYVLQRYAMAQSLFGVAMGIGYSTGLFLILSRFIGWRTLLS